MARHPQLIPAPNAAGQTVTPQLADDFLRICPARHLAPLIVVLGEKRLGVARAVVGEVAPPMIVLAQHPHQRAVGIAEGFEGRQLHGIDIERHDLAALGLEGIIRMRAQQLAFPEKSAVQMPRRARAQRHTLARRPVIFRHRATRDGIKESLIRCGRLMRLRRGPLAHGRPLPSQHNLGEHKKAAAEANFISWGFH